MILFSVYRQLSHKIDSVVVVPIDHSRNVGPPPVLDWSASPINYSSSPIINYILGVICTNFAIDRGTPPCRLFYRLFQLRQDCSEHSYLSSFKQHLLSALSGTKWSTNPSFKAPHGSQQTISYSTYIQ